MADEQIDERVAKEKASVEKMRGAQSAMTDALNRIKTLESALGTAINGLSHARGFISTSVYTYQSREGNQSVHQSIDYYITEARKAL